jgi:transcriptional regulator NrdR family protein
MVNVLKATGTIEPFSEEKLRNSMSKTGATSVEQDKVIKHIERKLYENIPTWQVYRSVTRSLESQSRLSKARYTLKRAIMELGPTGYPFEDYVSEILKVQRLYYAN